MRDNVIISIGYNGAPAGHRHCEDIGCDLQEGRCIRAVHAEANAIAAAARNGISTAGATIYTTCAPCLECAKLIVNSGITSVVYREGYRDDRGLYLIASSHVGCRLHTPGLGIYTFDRRQETYRSIHPFERLGIETEESSQDGKL